ncbi:MAG: class I SAM-dependent methyltransferase [Candidatus Acidiferrum sp.]
MSLRTEYDTWHKKYHDANPFYDDTSTPWYQWVAGSIGNVDGLRTLEVACGRGGLVRKLARSAALSCGLDFSFAAVSIGKERWKEMDEGSPASFTQGDAQELPFPDAYFDVVISCETIEHLPSPVKALREFHRVTRNEGRLLLTTPNYLNFMGLYELYAKIRHPERKPDQPFDRVQLFTQVREQVNAAGWKIIRSDGTVHQVPIWPGRNPVRLTSLESNVRLRKLLSIFALHYCLIAKKK